MTECVVKKRAKAIDVTMSLHGMWASFTQGNDALAWVNRKGENVTQSQLAILRAAACSYDTRPIERPPEQHELVRRAVEHIVEEETRSIGGQLGAASGARRKTYARLKEYIDTIQPTLFPAPPELHSALEDIYKYPLQETARDTLNRQLRSGISDEQLAHLTADTFPVRQCTDRLGLRACRETRVEARLRGCVRTFLSARDEARRAVRGKSAGRRNLGEMRL